eukprot:scaffold13187_cov112-Isochrysis_galbana.AAC.1
MGWGWVMHKPCFGCGFGVWDVARLAYRLEWHTIQPCIEIVACENDVDGYVDITVHGLSVGELLLQPVFDRAENAIDEVMGVLQSRLDILSISVRQSARYILLALQSATSSVKPPAILGAASPV